MEAGSLVKCVRGAPLAGVDNKLRHAVLALAIASFATPADARDHQDTIAAELTEAAPALAPFQHIRFCLRYPSDCKSNPAEAARIDLTPQKLELLDHVNRVVNATIVPTVKTHGAAIGDGWTIAPSMGDCNDYAVTKRHALVQSGLPAKALRLSIVKTRSEIGHLVLVVVTTKGDLVLDNLTETIRPWQSTDYRWLKIQSAGDARLWFAVRVARPPVSQPDRKPSKGPTGAQG
jgi:predicted transglutaminase-like cysteine proteinase